MKHPTRARVLLRIGLLTPPKGTTMSNISAYLKAVAAFAGTLLMVWNEYSPGFADILPASWSHGITLVVAILTVVATFGVPNTTNDPAVAATQSVALKAGRHELPEGGA